MADGEQALERDVELLQSELGGPRLTLITTSIVVVERCDRPGWECPITGSNEVRALTVQPDLSFLVNNETKQRTNRWTLDPDEQADYDELCSEAVDYREAAANGDPFWHVPIVWTVGDTEVEDLLDDETQTIYLSGGWRSSKTYRLLRWWQRGWAKYGRIGERFWLTGPEIINAWRLYEKAFIGSAQVPPLFPSLQPGLKPSFLLENGPSELSYDRRKLSGRMCDGSIAEQYHLKGKMGHVEGESVRRAAYDEAASSQDARGYNVLRGRVMQCRGQVGISSVPDEECEWLYSGVVAEYEKHGCHQPRVMTHFERERPLTRTRIKPRQIKVRFVSIYDNPFVADEALDRALEGETDPVVADNKFRGWWTRRGQHAYLDVWSPDRYTRDELSDRAEAWGLGADITRDVVRECFNRTTKSGYGGYVDFSEGGDKPQSRGWWKVFGRSLEDWESWNLVFVDEESTRSDALQAAAESARRKQGRYVGSALVGDSNGFHKPNREGGSTQKHNASQHWQNAGFEMVAVIRTVKNGKAAYSLPLLGESRTVVRDVMRRGRLWVNAGACPGIVNALVKAPNRRKKNADKNTWIEKQVYGHEDGVRYVCWRLFAKRLEKRIREFEQELEQGTG